MECLNLNGGANTLTKYLLTTARLVCLLPLFLWQTEAIRIIADESGSQTPPLKDAEFSAIQTVPVFTGAEGQWDARIRERGWILREGPLWKMWYTGYNPDLEPAIMRLGYATSSDGINWQRFDRKPLLHDVWVEDMMVVRHEDRYLMFAEGFEDQAQLLESPDGIRWTRIGTLDIRQTSGAPIVPGPFGTPVAFHQDGIWNLFYERRDEGIWLARSPDLKVWTNVSDDPVIRPGPEEYDRLMIAMNQVVRIDDRYVAVLHGTGTPQKPRLWCTTLAESSDLIHWTRRGRNPLFPAAANKSSGLLIHDGVHWRLYTMHDRVEVHMQQVP